MAPSYLSYFLFGAPPKATKAKKSKKKKFDDWFESCNANQLKELCKAAKLPVSCTKPALVQCLMSNKFTRNYQGYYLDQKFGTCPDERDFPASYLRRKAHTRQFFGMKTQLRGARNAHKKKKRKC